MYNKQKQNKEKFLITLTVLDEVIEPFIYFTIDKKYTCN